MKDSHKVQSIRGTIERMFAHLKKFDILHGGSVDSIVNKEMELDIAMCLHNLTLRVRLNLLESISARPSYVPGAHIFTSNLQPKDPTPKAVKETDAKFPKHVKDFIEGLSSIGPTLKNIVLGVNQFDYFTERTMKRGENLFLGGNVVQIAVEKEDLDVWRIRFNVGASRKYVTYKCYARLNKDSGVLASICECKAG